ncbi:hypothetical protein E5163_05750 [Marinicauda algicola]|uniref:Uncharacterized protein n=1 Tax=Marinicauda algicola TaxID=2029849 RepID=A0A4S2H4N9_9PROT|nr:hypothetical protein [Marinicauda algicola]TGY90620.1 hypothetical protein E5163_05750 [Marinicauda algicola]
MAERAHETSDVPIRSVLFWTGLATLAVALALAVLFLVFQRGDPGADPEALWANRPQEGVRLQRDPARPLEVLRERDRSLLEDGPLTIDEAMVRTAEAGWREGDPDPSRASEIAEGHPHLPALDDPREADLAADPEGAVESPLEDAP